MTSDLRDCCQRAEIDGLTPEQHAPRCDARRTSSPATALSAPCATCGHVEVLHNIRGNGTRGACSISTGAKAVPCGCKAFSAADDGGLFPAPDRSQGGAHL